MEEADIPKTAFYAGSSGLFEFTRMPFGLTNAGASFCRLMEMVIGDKQFVTLLFYLDNICIFANSADQMLDRIELVFSRLKQYQLKSKPKKSFFFQTEVSFLGHVLSAKGIRLWFTTQGSKLLQNLKGINIIFVQKFKRAGPDTCTKGISCKESGGEA